MSVNYDATTKNNRMQQALNAIDGGTGDGLLVIGTAALSGSTGVLATITLQKPSFSLSGGVLTLLGVPLSATASAGGTAAKAELRDSSGAVKVSGLTVGTSSADVIINSVTISASQTVQVVSPSTLTHN